MLDLAKAGGEGATRIEALGIWRGPLNIERLDGGISNESYRVRDEAGDYVVRFGRDFPFHHVSRERETMTARAAHEAGLAPEVVYSAPGVMVCRFIEARPFTAQDVRSNIPRLADLLQRFHTGMPTLVSGRRICSGRFTWCAIMHARWLRAAAA